MYAGSASKTVRSLENACHTWAPRVITSRLYTNLHLPYLYVASFWQKCLLYSNNLRNDVDNEYHLYSCLHSYSSSLIKVNLASVSSVLWFRLTTQVVYYSTSFVDPQSAVTHSQLPAPRDGTTCRLTSQLRRHSRSSDSALRHFCSRAHTRTLSLNL